MTETISINLEEETKKKLKTAVISLEERCEVVVTPDELAALCVETVVDSGRLDELLDKLVLEALAALEKQMDELKRIGTGQ